MKNANYRKHNNRQGNSSTYHKKDGTNTRAILKKEAEKEINYPIIDDSKQVTYGRPK